MRTREFFPVLVFLVLLLLIPLGIIAVWGLTRSQSEVTTTVAGRSVSVTSSGEHSTVEVSSDRQSAKIAVNGLKIVVDANQVKVENEPPIDIPQDCRRIELRASGGQIDVFFEGQEAP